MPPPAGSRPADDGAQPPQGSAGASDSGARSPGGLDSGEQHTPLLGGASEQRDLSGTQIKQQLREVFGDRFAPEEVAAFARDILEELAKVVGEDALRKDEIERAMAITVPRVMPFRCCCLTLMTLGLYYFVRPHDNVAVLLLQKSGHVLMLRKEDRPGWSGELKFLICIILFNLIPPLLGTIVYFFHGSFEAGVAVLTTSINTDARYMHRVMKGSFALLLLALVASWAAFTTCIWCHRQRGYGTRAVRRFKCAYIAAAQFLLRDERNYVSFCCRRVHQRGRMRLFFGKYPAQAQMDEGARVANRTVQALDSITSGSAATSTEESPTSAEQQQRGGGRGGPLFALLFFLLSVVFQLSVLYEYYEELLRVVGAQTFCGTVTRAARHSGRGADLCRPELCRGFFSTGTLDLRIQPPLDFCRHVRWVANATYLCPVSRAQSCCTFCVAGAWYDWMGGDDPQEWIKSVETVLTYVAAIAALFTGAAVITHLSRTTFTPQVQLDFVHDVYQSDERVFQMKSELAQDFMHRMFAVDGAKAAAAVDENRDNVVLLGREEAPSWQAFFGESRRLTRLPVVGGLVGGFEEGRAVCVPETCLGLAPEEKVLKAWDEKAFLSGGDLWRGICLALLLAVALVYGPRLLSVRMPSVSTMDGMLHAHLHPHARAAATITTTSSGAAFDDQSGSLMGVLAPTFAVVALAAPMLPVLLLLRWIRLIIVQCAVVVTSHRVFSIAYRPNFLWVLPFGWSLRIDIFRHDSNLFYGRMTTTPPPLLSRLCTSDAWRSGEVVMQSIFGVLQLQRSLGEVREIFDMVATRLSADVEEKDGIDPRCGAVDVEKPFLFGVRPGSTTRAAMGTGKSKVTLVHWESALREDPRPQKAVPVKSVSKDGVEGGGVIEHLLFVWSFQEEPRLTTPLARFNDIAITTDSIRLSSSAAVKPFDCLSCWCWPFPFYALKRLVLGGRHLPEMQSFLNFSHLQAFSTEYAVEPPLFPYRCPCWEVLCRALTRCAQCYWCRGAEGCKALRPRTAVLQASGELLDCEVVGETEGAVQVRYCNSLLEDEWLPRGSERLVSDGSAASLLRPPRLASTRMGLFLMVLQKYAQEVQPDLILCLRPCYLEVHRPEEAAGGALHHAESFSDRVMGHLDRVERMVAGSSAKLREDTHTLKEVRTLRALLNIVLENAEAKDLQHLEQQ